MLLVIVADVLLGFELFMVWFGGWAVGMKFLQYQNVRKVHCIFDLVKVMRELLYVQFVRFGGFGYLQLLISPYPYNHHLLVIPKLLLKFLLMQF